MSEPAGEMSSERSERRESGSKVKEEKYLVLKLDDIEKYLTDREKFALTNVCLRIREGRDLDGKKQNHYVVVNEEEPYAEKVWDLVLGRV